MLIKQFLRWKTHYCVYCYFSVRRCISRSSGSKRDVRSSLPWKGLIGAVPDVPDGVTQRHLRRRRKRSSRLRKNKLFATTGFEAISLQPDAEERFEGELQATQRRHKYRLNWFYLVYVGCRSLSHSTMLDVLRIMSHDKYHYKACLQFSFTALD